MGWFGLFDRLRLRTGLVHEGRAQEGWPMPGGQLRLVDRDLAAFYRGAILAAGRDWRADTFDIAAHHFARLAAPSPGGFHIEARLTGRPQQILVGQDAGRGFLAWHAPSRTATLRLPGDLASPPVTLAQASLDALLEETLPIRHVASLSAWVADAASAQALLHQLAPLLTRDTQAIIRMPATSVPDSMAALATWPARCAAIVPCSGAPDSDGRGEDPTDLILCLEALSEQSVAEAGARAEATPRRIRRETWNDHDRDWRGTAQGGIAMRLPPPDRNLAAGWPLRIMGDVPPGPAGTALAAMQAAPYRAATGFDYVLEIGAATLLTRSGLLFILPQDGPVVIEPALYPGPDLAEPAMAAAPPIPAHHGVLAEGVFTTQRTRPIHAVSDRPAFLLGPPAPPSLFLAALWPRLEHLFQLCDRERLSPGDFDILVPGATDPMVRACLELAGIPAARIRTETEGVLFRRLLVASPASHGGRAQRAACYDQFWARLDRMRGAPSVSFSRLPPPDRFYLLSPDGPALLNAAALQAAAERRGFRLIDTATAGTETIATLLSGARALIGSSRALAWACLAHRCALGAWHADADPVTPHALLHAAAAREHTVNLVFGNAIGPVAQGGFAIDPERFEALLDRVESGLVGTSARPSPASTGAAG